jgi:hypothetical protein
MWHVCGAGEVQYSVQVRRPEGKNHSKNLGVGGSIILKRIFNM